MLFFIGRIAVHRLAATAAATSSSRLVIAKQLGRVRAGFIRAYATLGRPTKTDTDSSTSLVGRPRKAAADAVPKKAAAKKTTATKTTTNGAKTAAKSPKAKKASPPPKNKKGLTEKQKANKELAKVRLEKAELKQKALFTEPKLLASSAWSVFVTRKTKGNMSQEGLGARMTALSGEFKALSQSEMEVNMEPRVGIH